MTELVATPIIDFPMNSLKRFLFGFALGIGAMYWYLHYGAATQSDSLSWMSGAASKYRDDKAHQAAREVLGNK